jgi:WD40 repeat protein
MGPYSRFKTNSCRDKSKVPRIAFSSSQLQRQISTVIVFLSVICAPIHGLAQTKEPEKRGVAVPSGPAQTSTNTRPILSDRPELILQTGHTQSVNAFAFSPDNRWLASGGKDNVIKIWDLSNGNVLRTLYGHASNINALAVSDDGQLLASGSGNIKDDRDLGIFIKGGVVGGEDNTVRIWQVLTGRELHVLRGHELPVGAVAFSQDGRFLTSVSGDAVKMWDVTAGTELGSQKTKYEKSGGEKLGSLSVFGSSKQEKQQQQRFKNFRQSASKIAVSANGQAAAIGQPDKAIKIYDAQSGREMRELSFKASPQNENSSLAFSADASLVAFAKTRDTVCVQEATTGRERYCVNTGSSKTPPRVQFSSDRRFLVTATADSATLKLWDANNGQSIRELNPGRDPASNFRIISFSRDGGLIAAVASGSKAIRIFATGTGSETLTLQTRGLDPGASSTEAFIKSIDSKTMAILQKRDITAPEQMIEAVEAMATLSSDKFQAGRAVGFSPEGRFLISRQMVLKNLVTEVWDSQTGMLVSAPDNSAMKDRAKPFYSLDGRFRVAPYFANQHLNDFSPASIFVPVASAFKDAYKQRVDLHDGQSDKRLFELDGGKAPDMGIVPATGFSFDGKLVAITGFEKENRSVLVYETEKGRKVNTFPINDDENSGPVTTLCISSDARFLAAGYATKIDIFEIATGKTMRTLPHAGRVVSLSFSPDGRFLVALGGNNDKELWETSTGDRLATLVSLGGATNKGVNDWLVVTPDGLFDGSPSAFRQILWQFGGKTFDVTPAETFFNEFYYPGLLAELMAGKKPRAPKNISQLDRRQPEIKLMTKDGQVGRENISERHLTVKIEVAEKQADKDHNAGSGAGDVRLFRNGALVKVWRGDVLKGQQSITLEANIAIVAGENHLSAYAFNRDNVKSVDASLDLTGASSLSRKGTAYVLAIGVNVYSNENFNLKYAVADATVFGQEVQRQQQQIGNYSHTEVVSLTDDQAKKANILRALRRLAGEEQGEVADEPAALRNLKATEPEDAVFIYFAGHGTAHGQRFYLIPHDLGYKGARTELDAAGLQTILENSISDEELERSVEGIDADKLLMVVDACNSGQALEAEERRRGPMNSKGLAQLAYEKGMYILTAAQSYQAAQEVSQLGHGLLTYALVEEGLKDAAADSDPKDSQVVVREWFDYATARVPNMQLEKLKAARDIGVGLSFVEPDAKPMSSAPSAERLVTQTPRAFYRRESEVRPLIVARR